MSRKRILMFLMTLIFVLTACWGGSGESGSKSGGKQSHFGSGRDVLRIVSGSENKELEPLIEAYAKENKVSIEMTYMGSIDIMRQLQANTKDFDAVWPASSIWISMGDTDFRVKHIESTSLNPVVFGIKKSMAESMGFVGKQVSINDLMEKIRSGDLKFCMTSATQSNSGASAYLGFLSGLSGNPEVLTMEDLEKTQLQEDITGLLQGVDRSSGSSEWLKTLFLQGDYDAMVNYESLIITTNQELVSRGDEIKADLDLLDSNQTVTFGVGAQRKLSDFSDTILNKIKNKDTGEVGELLSDLLVSVKGLEIEDLGESKGILSKLPIFDDIKKRLARFKSKYESVEVQIDRIEGQLDQARIQMLKDITMFDELYAKNLEYFNDLNLYIMAGEEVITEMRNVNIPKLREEAQATGDPMSAQLVSDFEDMVNRFEKKVHDLKLSKTMSIQTAPQIKLIQNNDKLLVDKIQTAILNTIPLWKSQIVIALGLARQESALKLQKEVSETTNELLLKNSEKLKQNTIEVAKESEKGIIEIETLKKINKDLIDTINETIKIQQEGRTRRIKAEEELVAIEGELKQSLLAARDK